MSIEGNVSSNQTLTGIVSESQKMSGTLSSKNAISGSLGSVFVAGEDGEVLPWEQPDSTNPYMTGDKVTHNGKTWVSDVDNNVWEPGVYGWTEV